MKRTLIAAASLLALAACQREPETEAEADLDAAAPAADQRIVGRGPGGGWRIGPARAEPASARGADDRDLGPAGDAHAPDHAGRPPGALTASG